MAALVDVNGAQVSPTMAAAWRPLVEAAKADGVNITGGGWRSSERQAELRRQNGCPDLTSPSRTCDTPTAPVGTSKHERGEAVDVVDASGDSITQADPEFRWLDANAARYGIRSLTHIGEPWHWELAGPGDPAFTATGDSTGGGGGGGLDLSMLTDTRTWLRVGMFLAGVTLALGGLLIIGADMAEVI